jgi:hypothetical protein
MKVIRQCNDAAVSYFCIVFLRFRMMNKTAESGLMPEIFKKSYGNTQNIHFKRNMKSREWRVCESHKLHLRVVHINQKSLRIVCNRK